METVCHCLMFKGKVHIKTNACPLGEGEKPPTKAVDKILVERGSRYGDFMQNGIVAQQLKYTIREGPAQELPSYQMEALDLMFTKISRILCGDHNYLDNWDDIAGYATLVADALRKAQHVAT